MNSQDRDTVIAKYWADKLKREKSNAEFEKKAAEHNLKMQLLLAEMHRVIAVMNAPLYDLMRDIKNS